MQFDFGKNWMEFSKSELNAETVARARTDFEKLVSGIALKDKKFLDIGFGQGLGLLTAAAMGAYAHGCDINKLCAEVLEKNRVFFPDVKNEIPVVVGSILEDGTVTRLKELSRGTGYDIVHSWGVLHHTGDMLRAIENSVSLVAPGGTFILAIYNRHWSSRPWLFIKWFYNIMPEILRKLMVYAFCPVIYIAKFLVTGKNPVTKERGMSFYYDVVDWVGGYPYEYASIEEIKQLVQPLGFKLVRYTAARVPTGNNEFIFTRTA